MKNMRLLYLHFSESREEVCNVNSHSKNVRTVDIEATMTAQGRVDN